MYIYISVPVFTSAVQIKESLSCVSYKLSFRGESRTLEDDPGPEDEVRRRSVTTRATRAVTPILQLQRVIAKAQWIDVKVFWLSKGYVRFQDYRTNGKRSIDHTGQLSLSVLQILVVSCRADPSGCRESRALR